MPCAGRIRDTKVCDKGYGTCAGLIEGYIIYVMSVMSQVSPVSLGMGWLPQIHWCYLTVSMSRIEMKWTAEKGEEKKLLKHLQRLWTVE